MKKLIVMLISSGILLTSCATVPRNQGTAETPSDVAVITPLPSTVDANYLSNCTVAVSLNEGDIYVDNNGATQMKVTVYTYDLYDVTDISQVKEGGKILLNQKEVTVSTLETTESGSVIINGGLDVGGYELHNDESGVYYETGYNDAKSYYSVGEATIRVSSDFRYIDASDLDTGEKTYCSEDFLAEDSTIDYHFIPRNTSIVIENSEVTSMTRVYIP